MRSVPQFSWGFQGNATTYGCDSIWLEMTYKVRMIGLDTTKCSNLSFHVCCVVFETRMVSIQERTQTPWMGVTCGLRPKPRNHSHCCKLVHETKPANKSRWKSANWKDSKPPVPSSNVAIWCPGCKEVFWKRYLYKYISQNHANLMITPTIVSSISMNPHERDNVKSLFENPG